MKKFFVLVFMSILIFTGCGEKMNNTPTKQVEMFFMNYQTLDSKVIKDLNDTVAKDDSMDDKQKDRYKEIMKEHYKNLAYDIKDEEINGDSAVVKVEIEVTDYSKTILQVNNYLKTNPEEFLDDDKKYDSKKFIDYKLDELEKVKDKVKYTLELNLTKIDDKWELDKLSSDDEDKILGIYEY